MEDWSSFIVEQLSKSGRRFITKSDHCLMQCPVHANGQERTPSRKINVSNPKYRVGESFCYACHDEQKKLSWNELAAITNMTPVRSAGETDGDSDDDELWFSMPQREDFYGKDDPGVALLPWKGPWRGISAKLLKKLYASLVNSRDEPRIYLPVTVDGVEVGNVQCVVDPNEESSKIKYLLSNNSKWTSWALYPVDYAFPLAEKLGYIVLVEGARDALNLLQHGVPAVCLWGTNGWTKAKRDVLQELGVRIVVAMDADDAGRGARDKIVGDLKQAKVKHTVITFADGRDPGSMSKTEVLELAEFFSPATFEDRMYALFLKYRK